MKRYSDVESGAVDVLYELFTDEKTFRLNSFIRCNDTIQYENFELLDLSEVTFFLGEVNKNLLEPTESWAFWFGESNDISLYEKWLESLKFQSKKILLLGF